MAKYIHDRESAIQTLEAIFTLHKPSFLYFEQFPTANRVTRFLSANDTIISSHWARNLPLQFPPSMWRPMRVRNTTFLFWHRLPHVLPPTSKSCIPECTFTSSPTFPHVFSNDLRPRGAFHSPRTLPSFTNHTLYPRKLRMWQIRLSPRSHAISIWS